jgi:hypothetical protein
MTRDATLAIAEYAFEFAFLNNRKKVTAVHKVGAVRTPWSVRVLHTVCVAPGKHHEEGGRFVSGVLQGRVQEVSQYSVRRHHRG